MKRLPENKTPFPHGVMASLFLLFMALIGYVDWITGPEVHFFVFYLLPITLVTWYYGKKWGYGAALFSVLLWHLVNLMPYSVWWYHYWNGGVRLFNFLVIIEFISIIRIKVFETIRLNKELQSRLDEIEVKSRHIQELQEQIQTVCAWTHRIKDEGKWISFEEYFQKHLNMRFSHGISEEALKKVLEETESPSKKP